MRVLCAEKAGWRAEVEFKLSCNLLAAPTCRTTRVIAGFAICYEPAAAAPTRTAWVGGGSEPLLPIGLWSVFTPSPWGQKMRPIWAICTKSGKSAVELGGKNFIHERTQEGEEGSQG